MTTKEMNCKKCGSNEVFIEQSGNNTGLYCSECGKWIKWLNKDELRVAERYIQKQEEQLNEDDENEVMFLGMNIMENVLNTMINTKEKAIRGMSEEQIKAYELGISNTLSYLQVLLCDSEHVVVNTFDKPEEYTYDDLKFYYLKKRLNSKN